MLSRAQSGGDRRSRHTSSSVSEPQMEGSDGNISDLNLLSDSKTGIVLGAYIVLLTSILLLSLTINISLLLVFAKKASLRTNSNRFVINLLVVNLSSSLVLLPLVALDAVPPLLASQCLVSEAVTQTVASLSVLSTLAIGWDQYLAVLRPLRYHHHMTRTISYVLITTVWTTSCLATVATTFFPSPSPLWFCCSTSTSSSSPSPSSVTISTATTTLTIVLPTLLLAAIYSHIYCEAHTSSARTRKNSLMPANSGSIYSIASTAAGPLGVTPAQILTASGSQGRSGLCCVAGRQRTLSTSPVVSWEEGRAAIVCLASLGALLLCWAPLATVSLASNTRLIVGLVTGTSSPRSLPSSSPPLVLLLGLLYSLLSPFLFAYRHHKVRQEVLRLWGVLTPRSGPRSTQGCAAPC